VIAGVVSYMLLCFITNLLRKFNLKITFQTNSIIQSLLKHKQHLPDIYTVSGVYRLKCPDYNKTYVNTKFLSRQDSHISNFAKHLNVQAHSFGSIHNTMQILQRQNKGSYFNTIESFYIYAEYLSNHHLNDEHTIFLNIVFEALLKPNQP